MKKIKCKYIIVNNENELERAEKFFKTSKQFIYNYPFAIGKEGDVLFYSKDIVLEDYYDKEEQTLYIYEEIKL